MRPYKSITSCLGLLLAIGGAAYAQTASFTVANAGNWGQIVAPDSIAAGFGSNLTNQQYIALSTPLPTQLGGVRVDINDSGKVNSSGALYLASPSQVNFIVPATVSLGRATVAASTATGTPQGSMLISNVAPAVFAANGNGEGAAAAQLLQVPPSGAVTVSNTFEANGAGFGTASLNLSPASDSFYLVLYATGIRRHSLNPVQASIGGVKVPVTYAGAVSGLAGLDQINLGPLPRSLTGTGKGDVDVVVTVDGVPANTVKVNVR